MENIEDKQSSIALAKLSQSTMNAHLMPISEQLNYAQLLIDAKLVTQQKPEEVVAIARLGAALGIPFEVATQNIVMMYGKPTLTVHTMTALAKKTGYIDWEIVKDYEPITKTYKNADGKEKKVIEDYVTTIRFLRYNPVLKRTIVNEISYYFHQAVQGGHSEKTQWVKMPRNMMRARCLSEGIRFIASDVLVYGGGAIYETSEILDVQGKEYEMSDTLDVIHIDN